MSYRITKTNLGKFVVSLEDACAHHNLYNTFLDAHNGGAVGYLDAFDVAFTDVSVLYMKPPKDATIVDGATFEAILEVA